MTPPSTRRSPQGPTGSTRRSAGFTLIELMVAVAIIGILASIAYPSYQRYVLSSRVSDGQSKLMEVAAKLERCYTVSSTYAGCIDPSDLPIISDKKYYSIDFSGLPEATFTLVATGSPGEVKCANLELDHTGQRDSDNDCW